MKLVSELEPPVGMEVPATPADRYTLNGVKTILETHYAEALKGPVTGVNAEANLANYIAKVREQMGLRTAAEFSQPANYKKPAQQLDRAA